MHSLTPIFILFEFSTPNEDNDHSTANPEPMLENPGSTSVPEPLPTGDTQVWSGTLEPQEAQSQSIIYFTIYVSFKK